VDRLGPVASTFLGTDIPAAPSGQDCLALVIGQAGVAQLHAASLSGCQTVRERPGAVDDPVPCGLQIRRLGCAERRVVEP
jgi:hypothetical protein